MLAEEETQGVTLFCYYAVILLLSTTLPVLGQSAERRLISASFDGQHNWSHLLLAVSVVISLVIAVVFVCRSDGKRTEWLTAAIAIAIFFLGPTVTHLIYTSFYYNEIHVGITIAIISFILLWRLFNPWTAAKSKSNDRGTQ